MLWEKDVRLQYIPFAEKRIQTYVNSKENSRSVGMTVRTFFSWFKFALAGTSRQHCHDLIYNGIIYCYPTLLHSLR